jgi:uncharacterized protein (TIGR02271 family)
MRQTDESDTRQSASRSDVSDVRPENREPIPVIQEELDVRTRVVDTGGVRLDKVVTERKETVDKPIVFHEVVVERVTLDRLLPDSTMPPVRQEGDTMVIPVVEEVLVVEKRLRLKEEVHVRRVTREKRAPQTVTLRSEHVTAEKTG